MTIPLPQTPLLLSQLEDYLLSRWNAREKIPVAFCAADEAGNLAALAHVAGKGLIRPILFGSKSKILRVMSVNRIRMDDFEIVPASDPVKSTSLAVEAFASGRAQVLMRGRILMHDFMKCLLHSPRRAEFIPKGALLSHVGVVENIHLPRVIIISDGGVVLKPDLDQKVKIIHNSIAVARLLGIIQPRLALLAAVETVMSGMPVSLEDAIISKMADRGQIKDAFIDGPLSLDGALIREVAESKGIKGPVAGQADILIVDKIEVGNAIYKALVVFGDSLAAGIVVGARRPIIITSRSDQQRSKIVSIYLSILACQS